MARLRGTVKWFDPEKGWGFIRLEDGEEVFVHHSDIQGEGFRSLKDGSEVELEIERADRGPRARRVQTPGGGQPPADASSGAERRRGGGRSRSAGAAGARSGGRDQSRSRSASRRESRHSGDASGPGGNSELPSLDEQLRRRLGTRFEFGS